MVEPVLTGPLEFVTVPGSIPVPLFVIAYDKDGVCTSPETAARAVEAARAGTDVILLSHGWNNDWDTMLARYRGWIEGLLKVRPAGTVEQFLPVFIGVYWPSIIAPESEGWAPNLAGPDTGNSWQDEVVTFMTAGLDAEDAAEVGRALRQPTLNPQESTKVAETVIGAFSGPDSDVAGAAIPVPATELRRKWLQAQDVEPAAPDGPVLIDDGAPGNDTSEAAPAVTAGLLDRLRSAVLKPLWLLRLGSVLLMKDRSGRVGGYGVAELLETLLDTVPATTRVHLVGHSFGSKVVLSALTRNNSPRPVNSVLLFEPAMSARSFAADADDHGSPGGYRPALAKSRSGIVLTYSAHDFPLTKLFHLAARRASDLGDVVIAGAAESAYAALGGFGPKRVDEAVDRTDPVYPPEHYRPGLNGRVLAIRGDDIIPGHGDVVSDATAWILADQLRS